MSSLKKSLGALALGLLAGAVPLGGQTPVEYKAKFPEGNADWTVSFEAKLANTSLAAPQTEEAKELSKHAIREIEIVRRGDLRRDIVRWADGNTSEFWWPADTRFVLLEAKNKEVAVVKSRILADRRLDESVFAWVGQKTFKKEDSFRGKKCLYFSSELSAGQDSETNEKLKKNMEAWLDAETMRPLAWSNGANLVTFKFKDAPSPEPLVMPERFKKEFDRWQLGKAPAKR